MQTLAAIIVLAVILVALFSLFIKRKTKPLGPFPTHHRLLLQHHVAFYKALDDSQKKIFENRVLLFLSKVRITGVKTTVEDIDRVLIASSAIIPIFGFPDWEYINLNEVLLYPDSFNHEHFSHDDRNTLGAVGSGAYQNIMILSKQSLREGFINNTDKSNVGIHEFVHLIDKTDGAVDGIPEFLLGKEYTLPWLGLIQREIANINAQQSDINPYGSSNQAEFLAVVSEYFFERPDLLEERHPELYKMLAGMFRQHPKISKLE